VARADGRVLPLECDVADLARVRAAMVNIADTAMAKQVHTSSIRAHYHDAIPLNRYGEEREIAEAVFFLCSEAARYVNGQTLAVGGGFGAPRGKARSLPFD
jgi:enoyl-[acyl-carrier-protein] reductase (NADH)